MTCSSCSAVQATSYPARFATFQELQDWNNNAVYVSNCGNLSEGFEMPKIPTNIRSILMYILLIIVLLWVLSMLKKGKKSRKH